MNKTYAEITDFWQEAVSYLRQEKKNEKLVIAIQKMLGDPLKGRPGVLTPIQQQYSEDKANINIKHCSVDSNGNILKDGNKELVYTQETIKKRNNDWRELLKKEYTFEPVIVEVGETDLDEYQKQVFKGFIIE